ncbi:hypothetical protein Tco_1395274, partial [Tanacetum coccineum]
KTITTLNEEITNLNNQLSKEKSTVSYLQEEKKKLKSDIKIREDELLDKQIQHENKIKELDNILVKTEKHDPPDVYDSEETLQLAQESRLKMKQLNKEIKLKATKFVRDFKSLTNKADESLAKHKALEFEIERLLRVVVSQDIMSIVQNPTVVDTSDLQTDLEHTFDSLSQKLEDENVSLEFLLRAQLLDKVFEQKDTSKDTSGNTKLAKQTIMGNQPLFSGTKLYSVTLFQNSKVIPKVGETNALSKPVTSNSAPSTRESKVMNNDRVIAPGMFKINPFKTYREEKSVPNKPTKVSVRQITVS